MPAVRRCLPLCLTAVLVLAGCGVFGGGGEELTAEERAALIAYHEQRQTAKVLAEVDADATPAGPRNLPEPSAKELANRRVAASATVSTNTDVAAPQPSAPATARTSTTIVDPADEATFEPVATALADPAPQADDRGSTQIAELRSIGLFGSLPADAFPDGSATGSMDNPGNLRRLTATTEGDDFDVAVSPDGKYVLFASTRHRERSDLYIKRIDGTAVEQITADPADDVMPAFSPDGERIAFASNRGGSWDLYLMDRTGGPAQQLTRSSAHDLHPSFSPDGRHLVFCSFGSQGRQWELVVIDVDNPATRKVIGHGLNPHWSPASDTIVFQRARQRGTRWFSIWSVDLVDGEAMAPTELAASANAACITPNWSPDGQHIVFCTVVGAKETNEQPASPDRADLWVMKADGSGRAKLTSGDHANLQPVWSSRNQVLFVSDRAERGVENLWAVRPDMAVQLADTPRKGGGWSGEASASAASE